MLARRDFWRLLAWSSWSCSFYRRDWGQKRRIPGRNHVFVARGSPLGGSQYTLIVHRNLIAVAHSDDRGRSGLPKRGARKTQEMGIIPPRRNGRSVRAGLENASHVSSMHDWDVNTHFWDIQGKQNCETRRLGKKERKRKTDGLHLCRRCPSNQLLGCVLEPQQMHRAFKGQVYARGVVGNLAGAHKNWSPRRAKLDYVGHFHAAHPGHAVVGDHQVVDLGIEYSQGLLSVARTFDDKTETAQKPLGG